MTLSTTSGTRRELYERPDLSKVKLAHVQLMRAYVNALAAASQFGRSDVQRKGRKFIQNLIAPWGWTVRWLVGSHIRRNLIDLGTVYLQLEQTFTRDDAEPVDSWLTEVRAGCLAVAEKLPRLRLPGIIAIVSAGAAVAGLLGKLPGWVGSLFVGLSAGLATEFFFFYPSMWNSYLYKRSLFLRDAKRIDKKKTEDQKGKRDNNIYALEDELYHLLHRGKRREVEIDKMLSSIGLGLIWYGAIGLTLWVSKWNPDKPFPTSVFVVSFIGGLVYILLTWRQIKRRRAWR
jgi:hypothetical protein